MLKREINLFGKRIDLVETSVTGIIQAAAWLLLCWVSTFFVHSDIARAIVFVSVAAFGFFTILVLVYGPPWRVKGNQRSSLSPSQDEQTDAAELPAPPIAQDQLLPTSEDELRKQLLQERAMARRWEYAYLNHFLVPKTQFILDWLYQQRGAPPSLTWYHTFFITVEQSEKEFILNVFTTHALMKMTGELMQITEKGCEYVEWRGVGAGVKIIERITAEQEAKTPVIIVP